MKLYLYNSPKKGGLFYIIFMKKGVYSIFFGQKGSLLSYWGCGHRGFITVTGASVNTLPYTINAQTPRSRHQYTIYLKRGSIRQSLPAHFVNGSASPTHGVLYLMGFLCLVIKRFPPKAWQKAFSKFSPQDLKWNSPKKFREHLTCQGAVIIYGGCSAIGREQKVLTG